MNYRLSRKAEDDLLGLYVSGSQAFGATEAEAYYAGLSPVFAFLADYPRAARERLEIDPPVRIHRYRSHVIVFVIDEPGIVILRIRHGREDWEASPV